ncbi:MAG: ATP-binding protein [Desulfuromonadales bacterium]
MVIALRTATKLLAFPAFLILTGGIVHPAFGTETPGAPFCDPELPSLTANAAISVMAAPFMPMLFFYGGVTTLLVGFFLWRPRQRRQREQKQQRQAALEQQLATARQEAVLADRRYRQVLDYAGDALFFIDPRDGHLLEANGGAEELLGYTTEQIRSLSLAVLFPGNHKRRYLRLIKKVLKDGYGEEGHLIFRRRDGREFVGAVHARLGVLGTDEVVHGVLRDVSHIKKTAQELGQKNKDLQLVNRIAYQGTANRNLQQMLGSVLEEVMGHLEADGGGVYLVRHAEETLDLVATRNVTDEDMKGLRRIRPGQGMAGRVASSGQPRSSVDLSKDHRLKTVTVRNSGWRGFQAVPLISNERNVGVLFLYSHKQRLFSRDEVRLLLAIGRQVGTAVEGGQLFDALNWQHRLTQASNRELEHSRQQLRDQLATLEENNRTLERVDSMKNRFLCLASHELRTPLTYVLSGSEYLMEQIEDRLIPEEFRLLQAIHQGGTRLNEIVGNLLEVARLESQSLHLTRQAIELAPILSQLNSEFHPIAMERELELQIDPPERPLSLYGDPLHLHKTFSRLLENAIKFTEGGGRITVTAATCSPDDVLALRPSLEAFSPSFFAKAPRGPFTQITVSDTGIGIDPEERHLIFDKFYEGGDVSGHFTSNSSFCGKGVGLGLTLVKGMVEAHGGMVWVDDSPTGVGSSFNVLLPMEEPHA